MKRTMRLVIANSVWLKRFFCGTLPYKQWILTNRNRIMVLCAACNELTLFLLVMVVESIELKWNCYPTTTTPMCNTIFCTLNIFFVVFCSMNVPVRVCVQMFFATYFFNSFEWTEWIVCLGWCVCVFYKFVEVIEKKSLSSADLILRFILHFKTTTIQLNTHAHEQAINGTIVFVRKSFFYALLYRQLSSHSQYLSFTLRGFFRSHHTRTRKYATNAINTIFLNFSSSFSI